MIRERGCRLLYWSNLGRVAHAHTLLPRLSPQEWLPAKPCPSAHPCSRDQIGCSINADVSSMVLQSVAVSKGAHRWPTDTAGSQAEGGSRHSWAPTTSVCRKKT